MENSSIVLSLISVSIISLVSLIGAVYLVIKKDVLEKTTILLVSLAVGTLFGDVFFHLLPHIYTSEGDEFLSALFIITGILIFFILEKFLRWRHIHLAPHNKSIKPVAYTNIVGDALHNFIDGMLVSASYMVSIELGITTTVTVILHEIPQEIGDFGVLVHSGFTPKKALMFNFLSAVSSFLGVLFVILISKEIEGVIDLLIPITAGGFIYIAGSDLIPELHHKSDFKTSTYQMIFMLIGIILMALLVHIH